jgi:hypothetical protein
MASPISMRPVNLINQTASPEADLDSRYLPFQGSACYWPAMILGVINPM